MQQWYLDKMINAKTLDEAKRYAQMAGLTIQQLMTIRYLKESK